MLRLCKISLGTAYQQIDADRVLPLRPGKRFHLFDKGLKERVRVRNRHHDALAGRAQLIRASAELASGCPEHRIAPVRRALNRGPQRVVPFAGPAAYNQAMLIENAIEQRIVVNRAGFAGGSNS